MTLRIKNKCSVAGPVDIVGQALEQAGTVLNGATKLGSTGYIGPSSRIERRDDIFVLGDYWFNGKPQDIDTVRKAVENATGIDLKFAPQMLSSEPPTIISYKIVDSTKYRNTVGRFIDWVNEENNQKGHW